MKTIGDLWRKLENVELVQVRPSEMEAIYKRIFEFEDDKPLIVEIGSAHGASSIILADAAEELDGKLICIDSFPENYYDQEKFGDHARQAFKANLKAYNIRFLDMPSSEAITEVRAVVAGLKPISVLFIDGMHSYEAVKQDCELYLPLLRPGGYVAFHDYNNVAFSGVKQAADEATRGWEKSNDVWDLVIFRKP
jgi:predicted O-methyltransferase YrrM